jgi:photosystem II stability/assembly factor-like uncharacterized protein
VKGLFGAILGLTVVASAAATNLTSNAPAPHAIAFLDARHGVLGTDRTLETSDDGGRTWTVRYHGRGPFTLVNERGGRRVWATAPRRSLASTDGGLTWRRLARRPVSGVAFGIPTLGWDVKERELPRGDTEAWLSETRDGGRNWRRMRRVCNDFDYGFAGLSHVAEGHGWIVCVGQPGTGMQMRAILETRDGGTTWSMRACGCPRPVARGRITWSGYPRGLRFTPAGDGVLFQFRGEPIVVTHDGGRTWRNWVGRPEVDFEVDASIVSSRLIYALAGSGHGDARLLLTTDGGRDWRLVRRWGSTRG